MHSVKTRLADFNERKAARGFTLVEILIAVAIVAILAGVILARYNDFDSVTLLESAAYDVALTIREAQVLGTGVRGTADPIGADNVFEEAYGVHFNMNAQTQYIVYRDLNGNYNFDPDDGEIVSIEEIGNDVVLGNLCASGDTALEVDEEGTAGDNCNIAYMDILFVRPELEPTIYVDGELTDPLNNEFWINVWSEKGGRWRWIRVSRTGQVSINPTDRLYGQGAYYVQGTYYSQSSYYSQSTYYSQSSYYSQSYYQSYYQSGYYRQSYYQSYYQSGYYRQSYYQSYYQGSYYTQGTYYRQGGYYSQGGYK